MSFLNAINVQSYQQLKITFTLVEYIKNLNNMCLPEEKFKKYCEGGCVDPRSQIPDPRSQVPGPRSQILWGTCTRAKSAYSKIWNSYGEVFATFISDVAVTPVKNNITP